MRLPLLLGWKNIISWRKLFAECEKSGVHTKFIPDYGNIIPTRPYTEDLLGLPVINIRYVPLSNTFNALIKRLTDIIGSIICIIIFSPIMLTSAVLVKMTSKGPLIFKQGVLGFITNRFRCTSFARCMCRRKKRNEKAGHRKMIQELPVWEDFSGKQAWMSFHSFLMC